MNYLQSEEDCRWGGGREWKKKENDEESEVLERTKKKR